MNNNINFKKRFNPQSGIKVMKVDLNKTNSRSGKKNTVDDDIKSGKVIVYKEFDTHHQLVEWLQTADLKAIEKEMKVKHGDCKGRVNWTEKRIEIEKLS